MQDERALTLRQIEGRGNLYAISEALTTRARLRRASIDSREVTREFQREHPWPISNFRENKE